jgi:transcriptional regulator with XRE-family HTH domain
VPRQTVPITGSVLRWAREEVGLSLAELADSVKVDPSDVDAWEIGESAPSKGNFSRLVTVLKRPSAIFFLPSPPIQAGLPTSFRNAPGLGQHKLGQVEIRQIRWARRLQEIASWSLQDAHEGPLSFPRYSLDDDSLDAGARYRESTDIPVSDQLSWDTASKAFRVWRSVLESQGILVLQLSLGKGNIRGFSAWDDYAPLVAVNTAFHPTARIFTLFHEVAHLLTRTDAACLRFILPSGQDGRMERWCETFSAAFLLPAKELRSSIYSGPLTAPSPTWGNAARNVGNSARRPLPV